MDSIPVIAETNNQTDEKTDPEKDNQGISGWSQHIN